MRRSCIFRWFSGSWCSGSRNVSGSSVVSLVSCWKTSLATFLSPRHWPLGIALAIPVAILFAATSISAQAPGKRSEILRTLPLTSFYDSPYPLAVGKPGELIRLEPFEEYELPPDVSAVRVLYHSRSAAGEDLATSGVILTPNERKPPAGGWPVIAWAHRADGVAPVLPR
jgi:hypothetical protein